MLPNVATAWISDTISSINFDPIQVVINDGAYGGCWTNLGEAKTYAEDKLINKGFQIVEISRDDFIITVDSKRHPDGFCYGVVTATLERTTLEVETGRIVGFLGVGESASIFIRPTNANTLVLDTIKDLIDEMPRK